MFASVKILVQNVARSKTAAKLYDVGICGAAVGLVVSSTALGLAIIAGEKVYDYHTTSEHRVAQLRRRAVSFGHNTVTRAAKVALMPARVAGRVIKAVYRGLSGPAKVAKTKDSPSINVTASSATQERDSEVKKEGDARSPNFSHTVPITPDSSS